VKLYGFWRSSAAYRVRIALAIKGLTYDAVSIHLSQGEHNKPEYGEINPQHLVPVLEDEGERLYQSLAIIQYLEDAYPEPPLIPDGIAVSVSASILPSKVAMLSPMLIWLLPEAPDAMKVMVWLPLTVMVSPAMKLAEIESVPAAPLSRVPGPFATDGVALLF